MFLTISQPPHLITEPATWHFNNKSKAFYLALILNPRIKKDGLTNIGLSTGIISDIYNRLKTDYNI